MLEYRIGYEYVLGTPCNTYHISLPTYLNPEKLVLSQSFIYICPLTGKAWGRARCTLPLPTEWRARYSHFQRRTSLFTPVERATPGFLESLPLDLLRHEFLSFKQELDECPLQPQ
jgi:hypothetical protein